VTGDHKASLQVTDGVGSPKPTQVSNKVLSSTTVEFPGDITT